MDPHTGVLPGLKVMVDRAKRWKFAGQQSPLAASPQENGTKVGGARSIMDAPPAEPGNPGPRRVGQVGVVESSAHRTSPFGPDQRSFKTHGNFSNTL